MGKRGRSIWERISEQCTWDRGCFVWHGDTVKCGYGRIRIGGGNGRKVLVHRATYEHFVGPIPDGMTIDHVKARGCHSRACCNVDHLEVVSFRENVMRGDSFAARHAKATHCPQGHPYDLFNTRLYQGRRYCRACNRLHSRLYRRRASDRELAHA
jgi:hypothetical protein